MPVKRLAAIFFFDPDEEEAITKEDLEKWAEEINSNMAAFVIGYEGWIVQEVELQNGLAPS
jgi:hypothetical protein